MEVHPLAVTQGDLQTFIKVCKDILDENPTRGLDQSYLKRTDPAAFLSVLKMDNKPLDTLRHKSTIWDHFSLSFLAVVDEDVLIELQNLASLKVFSRKGRKLYVAVLTGSISDWFEFGNITEMSPELQELQSKILGHLKRVGFREIFNT